MFLKHNDNVCNCVLVFTLLSVTDAETFAKFVYCISHVWNKKNAFDLFNVKNQCRRACTNHIQCLFGFVLLWWRVDLERETFSLGLYCLSFFVVWQQCTIPMSPSLQRKLVKKHYENSIRVMNFMYNMDHMKFVNCVILLKWIAILIVHDKRILCSVDTYVASSLNKITICDHLFYAELVCYVFVQIIRFNI